MKKFAVILLTALMVISLVACQKQDGRGDLRTGVGVIFSNTNSKNPEADQNGKIESQAYAAAVIVDEKGRVLQCALDTMVSAFEFTADNVILTDPMTAFKTKNELGYDYGMKKASSIDKEWFEQAQAFADYFVGKDARQIRGLSVTEGKVNDPDLASSATLAIAPFQAAVLKAISNSVPSNASSLDKLGLGIVGSGYQTIQEAQGDQMPQAVAYNFYSASTFDQAGKITSCVIDASQAVFKIEDGQISSDLTAPVKTKNDLGDAYGMKKASSIDKEWYEQAKAFANFVVDKTVSETRNIHLTDGVPAGVDLASSVTITVTDMISVVERAAQGAY